MQLAAGFRCAQSGLLVGSAQILARIVRLARRAICASARPARDRRAPAARCAPSRTDRRAALGGQSLALEAEGAAAAGAGGIGELDRAVERRHADLAAEHRLVERERQFEPQIGAVALEQRMRRDRDGDERIADRVAGRAAPAPSAGSAGRRRGRPESSTSTSLPVGRCTRRDPPLAASASEMVTATDDVAAGGCVEIVRLEMRAGRRTRCDGRPPPTANMSLSMSSKPPTAAVTAARALEPVRPPGEALEIARTRRRRPPGWAPKPSKPWKRGLPSASISPRSNALRLLSSPRIS